MSVPTVDQARALLASAEARNPGPWVSHSRYVAAAARAIASRHPHLDPDTAYVLGLLHDVGRGAGGPGIPDVRHLLDGYQLLHERGDDMAARICLTHSFPIQKVEAYASPWDCPPAERRFVEDFLSQITYTAYDRLIQLCDVLALPSGFCLIERRMVDVVLRHGFNALTIDKWRAYFDRRREFETAIGGSLYRLLPGVVENTFDWPPPAGEE